MSESDTDEEGLFASISPSKVMSVVAQAKIAGKKSAIPVIQRMLRDEIVRLLREHDTDELEKFIDVSYPMVRKELPDGYRNALRAAGPVFGEEIQQSLNPQTVFLWLEEPEEWIDPEEHPDVIQEIREINQTIRSHPDGEEYVAQQILAVYVICGLLEDE